jgi:DNA-binding CsgD family transcriptional regulator
MGFAKVEDTITVANSEPAGFEDAAISALHWEAGELLKVLSARAQGTEDNGPEPQSEDSSCLTHHLSSLLNALEDDAKLQEMLEQLPALLGTGIWLQPIYSYLFPGIPQPLAVTLPPTSEKLKMGPRECEILQEMAKGRSKKEIAEQLFISPATVKKHFENIYKKLDAAGPQQAVLKATALGLLDSDITDFMQLMREKSDMDYSSFGYALFRGLEHFESDGQAELARKVASLGLLIFLLVPLSISIRSNYGFGKRTESHGCLFEFSPEGELVKQFGEELNLHCPRSLAFAPPNGRHGFSGDNLFVLDGLSQPNPLNLDGIVELTSKGNYVRSFTGGKYLSSSLVQAWNLAFTRDGRLLVTSAISTDAVLELSDGGRSIRHFADLVPFGGIAVDIHNHVCVVGGWSGDSPIQVYDTRGRSLRTMGEARKGIYQGLAADRYGNLYVANIEESKVEVYDEEGSLSRTVGLGVLEQPHRLAVDDGGKLYVLDRDGSHIQVFGPTGSLTVGFAMPPGVRLNDIAIGPNGNVFGAGIINSILQI